MTKMLLIGSCTGAKEIGNCKRLLTKFDFKDAKTLRHREAELRSWALPASDLYLGWQHQYMMRALMRCDRRLG